MKQEIEYFDLRQVPNEFIIAAYNLVSDFPLSDVDIALQIGLDYFLQIIDPNCLRILEKQKQQILDDYKKEYLDLVNKCQAEKLLGDGLNKKFQDLQEKTRTQLAEHRQIAKTHAHFYLTLKKLINEYSKDLQKCSVITLDPGPNKSLRYNIAVYPNYVFGINKRTSGRLDFYTKQEESAINSLIDSLYSEATPVDNATSSENE